MSNSKSASASKETNKPVSDARLIRSKSGRYWRSLGELENDEEFLKSLGDEFAPDASVWLDATSRRNFLRLMGASLALAGVVGCNDFPSEKIVPYVNQPESVLPDRPTFYATSTPFCGFALGTLAESHEGRPTKIEGNTRHPASLGASNVFVQASVLDLYDPDRSRLVTKAGVATSWGAFYEALGERLHLHRNQKGDGLYILTRTITSPTFSTQLQEFRRQFPGARWHVHDPTAHAGCSARTSGRNGGAPGNAVYDFSKADVILSLDGDFAFSDAGSLAYARQFVDGRRRKAGQDAHEHVMNRLYVVESTFSITGSMADHRIAVRPGRVMELALAIAARLGVEMARGAVAPSGLEQFVDVLAEDLKRPHEMGAATSNGGVGLVVAGDEQPPELQALAFAMNQTLGSVGRAVRYIDPVPIQGSDSLKSLAEDMAAGKVETLLILGGNPTYDAPADVPFAKELRRMTTAVDSSGNAVHCTAHLGSHEDETSFDCQWHIPESHYLESWGDGRAYDGTASIIQPLILPLSSASRSIWEFMQAVLGRPDLSGYEAVRSHWQSQWTSTFAKSAAQSQPSSQPRKPKPATNQAEAKNFEEWWSLILQNGVIENSAFASVTTASGRPTTIEQTPVFAGNPETWDLVFRPDMAVWDGQYANNAWLQELPRPFTKLVWDNAALISYRSAEKLGITDGSVVRITLGGRTADIPVLVVPGIPDQTLTVSLGYGRARGGHVVKEDGELPRGFSAYALRSAGSTGFAIGAEVVPVPNASRQLVVTRSHHAMFNLARLSHDGDAVRLNPSAIEHPGMDEQEVEIRNRKLVRSATLADFHKDPHWVTRLGGETEMREKGISPDFPGRKIHLTLYPDAAHGGWDYSKGYQWAMNIDQTACIGCNACVIACQAENNIPVVGKEQCSREREMHWIRIDDWFGSWPGGSSVDALDDPQVIHMPVPCQHCENAPCEVVCPVGATTHSVEGLNEMTYNRCVGTRYCSNNCPYKVRRFNFLLYSDFTSTTRALQYNPDVTVRSRGVMEKCTYCVQRLNRTRTEIEKMTVKLEERAQTIEKESPSKAGAMRDEIPKRQKEMLGQLQTACQQACPTEAIVFGSKSDPASPIAQLKEDQLTYTLLADLTTQPRTSYLARLRNPNPKLTASGRGAGA